MITRFDDAWAQALAVARRAARRTGLDVVMVRDMLGRISLVVDDSRETVPDDTGLLEELAAELARETGPFNGPAGITRASELFAAEAILRSRDLLTVDERSGDHGQVSVLERGVVGSEWLHPLSESDAPRRNRVALYGFKGGVGRSTATFMLAQHLAENGHCVLAVDLDLESPGLGSLLQSDSDLPEYGLIDYLAESAVGNEEELDLVAQSRVAKVAGNGEVWVAPAGGRPREGYEYLPKLNRAYLDLPAQEAGGIPVRLAQRLESAIQACEKAVADRSRRPDVVLMDSRAGIHDVAAIAITQLADFSLLFASDSAPTWNGYRSLFRQWGQDSRRASAIRERLRMVATMVPRDRRESYLDQFRDRAQTCFAATLYDNVPGGGENEETDFFNPAPDDETAPHYPLPILFIPELVGLDLAARRGWEDIDRSAYAAFLEAATDLILGGSDDG